MNIWKVTDKIFKDKELEKDDLFNPKMMNSILSFETDFIPTCDVVNFYIGVIADEMIYKLFRVFLRGEQRHIKYKKGVDKSKNVLFNVFEERVKKKYDWSKKELAFNYGVLRKNIDDKFLRGIGFSLKERGKIQKILGKKKTIEDFNKESDFLD